MCGLFGFSDCGHKLSSLQLTDLVEALAMESAIRGTDATGIAYNIDGKLEIEKEAKSAYEMSFKLPKDTRAVIGHTRHSTQGSCKKKFNNHPFKGRLKDGGTFALAHNGIIANDAELREKYSLPKTRIETDSYVSVQLLERHPALSFETMKEMAEALAGSFSFSILDDSNNVYLIKGDSPLSILHFTKLGLYVYASTDRILWRALATSMLSELKAGQFEEIKIEQGEILKLSSDGTIDRGSFEYLSDYYASGFYKWWEYGKSKVCCDYAYDEDYYDELKSMASSFGYTPDDIEYMRRSGFSLDEIEEALYCEDFLAR